MPQTPFPLPSVLPTTAFPLLLYPWTPRPLSLRP
jgi:hypothetical protein